MEHRAGTDRTERKGMEQRKGRDGTEKEAERDCKKKVKVRHK